MPHTHFHRIRAIAQATRPLWLVAVLSACTGTERTSETDTDVIDECAPYNREAFEAEHINILCEYYVSCPDSYPSVQNCMNGEFQVYEDVGCWNECQARECIEWVLEQDECTSVREYDVSCELFWNCR